MIFLKKQHEEIASGFLTRMDLLLRQAGKAVVGYSIDGKEETLKLKIGQSIVSMTINGQLFHHAMDERPIEKPAIADAKEILY